VRVESVNVRPKVGGEDPINCAGPKQNIGLQIYIVALTIPAVGWASADQWRGGGMVDCISEWLSFSCDRLQVNSRVQIKTR